MSEEKENLEENIEGKNNEEIKHEEVQEEKNSNNQNNDNIELQNTKHELEETTDRLKRIMAEFENYKKRSSKERDMLYSTLVGDIIESFLPVIDNLEKAISSETQDKGLKQGIELVYKQFMDVLTKFNVEEIKTVGETFDPEVHEAVSSIQDETKGEKEITMEYRKGYKIGTRVIRHAMVVVAN